MQRYFVKEALNQGQEVNLMAEDSHHLLRVMRAQHGQEVYVVDGQGQVWLGQVLSPDKQASHARIEVVQPIASQVELPVEITLACGLSKNDKLEWIVQKATECGMTEFIPLALKRDVVKWQEFKAQQKVDRLQKIAKEAAEQAHRTFIPHIHSLSNMTELLEQVANFDVLLVAYEETAKAGNHTQLKQTLSNLTAGQRILVVFGSEGGLEFEEVDQLLASGFKAMSLGPRILRAETAPIYFLSAASYVLELN
ncbi:16S rRNA (uracil(1498)-N(3))-methyltransferase [Vaginisenegalia massiliensis]|uniref:16S rRNA (uracil(1498)-N(3))-methyltransferase n=1 Tax=Vaginisenegalia massiliensis TaxID=2058294 RepID=UPI000F5237FD|nr:16S rRNA (uracil(1498)-N(3))-methyltransferase [Vaginisenegalia massiliensis]